MPTFGPFYCESLAYVPGVFPAQPFNAFSNVAILYAVAALYLTVRRAPRAYDLYVLCLLFFINGVGSFLWHGALLRTALRIEVWAALLFLLGVVYLWARRVMPVWQALLTIGGFYVLAQVLRYAEILPYGRWSSMAPAVILAGLWLIWRTWEHSKRAAMLGGVTLASAILAVVFRSVDQAACSYIPFGTHFLWHIFLATAGFLGILALLMLTNTARLAKTA